MRAAVRFIIRSALQKYPLVSGVGTLANGKLPRWASADLKGTVIAKLKCGAKIIVNPQEFLGRSVYYAGEWDHKVTWVIRRLLRPGDTFIDIGAHCGITALSAASIVGSSGTVYAFEPQPDLADLMDQSGRLNGFSNLRVHKVALSNEDGEGILFIPWGKQIYGTFLERPGHSSIKVTKVNSGSFLNSIDGVHVRLIKIDVEGHEYEVLRGAEDFLLRSPPDAILIESVWQEGPFLQRKAISYLSKLGYSFIELPKSLFSVDPRIVNGMPRQTSRDFVAAAPGKLNSVAVLLNAH